MSQISSMHHSFDILLAQKYGMIEAILIHHFQHWIRINKTRKVNFLDGHTWTYQTLQEIADHFPYLSVKMIRGAIQRLIDKKIIKKGNYNKNHFVKTMWYAFVDEKIFVPFIDNSNNVYESDERANAKAPEGKCKRQKGKSEGDKRANDIYKEEHTEQDAEKEENKQKNFDPKTESASPQSADASFFSFFTLQKIKEELPNVKPPPLKKWNTYLDQMFRLDKRNLEETKQIFIWALKHSFYGPRCLNMKRFRESYDEMQLAMLNSATSTRQKKSSILCDNDYSEYEIKGATI